jgi:hypothetical protein
MNKVDLELEEVIKSLEKGCHEFKQDIIEWSSYDKVWIHWRWLLKRVERYLEGKIPATATSSLRAPSELPESFQRAFSS